jgi:ABC-type Fe3+/spermidine/putrescine transport system ATPase subunit
VIDMFQVLALLPKREVRVMEELNRMANQIRREQMDWQAQQQQDEEVLHKAALEALKDSLSRPLSEGEAMAVATTAGLANELYLEIRHEQK